MAYNSVSYFVLGRYNQTGISYLSACGHAVSMLVHVYCIIAWAMGHMRTALALAELYEHMFHRLSQLAMSHLKRNEVCSPESCTAHGDSAGVDTDHTLSLRQRSLFGPADHRPHSIGFASTCNALKVLHVLCGAVT